MLLSLDQLTSAAIHLAKLTATSLIVTLVYALLKWYGLQSSDALKEVAFAARGFSITTRLSTDQNISSTVPPCESTILQAEAANREIGHENLGALSFQYGFVPSKFPLLSLPGSHRAWDVLAEQLPHLINTQTLRAEVNNLPLLGAHRRDLPDKYLLRAATILGVVAHAYMRLEGEFKLNVKYDTHDEVLPACIHVPWTQISRRLGRRTTTMTFLELVLHNFKTTAETPSQIELKNLELLVPAVNNATEKVFYSIMIEINARTTPVIHDVVEIQRAVMSNDVPRLKEMIKRATSHVQDIRTCLNQLHACPSKTFFVDPVVWTQTVADLPIPWLHNSVGFAGTALPFFPMMDELISRHQYDTKLGKEALKTREFFPPHWQQFLLAVRKISVDSFVQQKDDKHLKALWQSMKDAYTGDKGLLGHHRRKAYGFLMVSFRLGRVSTIGGLGQKPDIQMWDEVDQELEIARAERPSAGASDRGPQTQTLSISGARHNTYAPHELMQCNKPEKGFWFAAQGHVYNATKFMESHPGGTRTITLVAGQVADRELATVAHLHDARIQTLMTQFRVGRISHRRFTSPGVSTGYAGFVALGYKIAEIEGIYRIAVSSLESEMTSTDIPKELNAHKARHFYKSRLQLQEIYALAIALGIEQIAQALSAIIPRESQHLYDDGVISRIKSRAENKGLINLNIDDLPDWDTAQAEVAQNLRTLAIIKDACVRVLADFEQLDIDSAVLDEDLYQCSARALMEMSVLVGQLGQ